MFTHATNQLNSFKNEILGTNMLLPIALSLILVLILKWVVKRKKDLQLLQNLGYKVPPISFIGGNLIELFTR